MTIKSSLVLPDYWRTGVAVLLFEGLFNQAIAHGYQWADMSITDIDNPTSVLTAEKNGSGNIQTLAGIRFAFCMIKFLSSQVDKATRQT